MSERPILFSGEMVRAILDGRKTQTRRVVKPQPPDDCGWDGVEGMGYVPVLDDGREILCPKGRVGDRLWVRETWQRANGFVFTEAANGHHPKGDGFVYRADQVAPWGFTGSPWKPSIFMPRPACRLTLTITGIRAERLQQIGEADAVAEGVASVAEYRELWDRINGKKHPWDSNPWVWVIEFERSAK